MCTHTFILGLPLIPHLDYLQTHLAHASERGVREQCTVATKQRLLLIPSIAAV